MIIFSIFIFLVELFAFGCMLKKVFKHHQLTIKDTIIYPLIILIVTIVIFCIEIQKENSVFWKTLVNGLSHAIDVVKLTMDQSYAEKFSTFDLNQQFLIVNYYISYVISATALFSLSISLVKATVKNGLNRTFLFKQKEKTYVFGFTEETKNFITGLTIDKKKNVIVLLDSSKLEKYVEERLFLEKYAIAYKKCPYSTESEMKGTIYKLAIRKLKRTKVNLITFFGDDSKNLNFVSAAKSVLSENDCYGGFYFDKSGKEIKKGDIIYVKYKKEIGEKKIDLKLNGKSAIALNKKNSFVFDTGSNNEDEKENEKGEYKLEKEEIADADQKKISLYGVDLNKFRNKKKNEIITIKKDDDYEIFKIKFKKTSNIFINVCCDGIQQTLIENIIASDDSTNFGEYYYDKVENGKIKAGEIVCVEFEKEDGIKFAKLGGVNPICFNKNEGYFIFDTKRINLKKGNNDVILEVSNDDKEDSENNKSFELISKKKSNKFINIVVNKTMQLSDSDVNYKAIKFKTFILNTHKRSYINGDLEDVKVNDATHGLIRTYNKYEMISYDFIKKYSFAKYINSNNINEDCTLENCDINLYVIGYGKINQVLLRDVLICNSFAQRVYSKDKKSYELQSKRINVKIYDKNKAIEDLNYSNAFTKYDKNSFDEKNHLELPDNYINSNDFVLDCQISNFDFIKKIYDDVKSKCSNINRMQYNFFIISIDSDSKNWDIANTLNNNLNDVFKNAKNIFFVRNKNYDFMYGNQHYFESKKMFGYGVEVADNYNKENYLKYIFKLSFVAGIIKRNRRSESKNEKTTKRMHDMSTNSSKKEINKEKHSIFSYSNVIDDELLNSAKEKHLEYEIDTKNTIDEEIVKISYSMIGRFKQKSNIYSVLGSYSKLNLIKKVNNSSENLADLLSETKDNTGKRIKHSYNELIGAKKYNISQVMAFIEHERWNAFEIGFGVLPMKITDVFEYNNENYKKFKKNAKGKNKQKFANQQELRYHLCITTMNGLVDLHDIIGKKEFVLMRSENTVEKKVAFDNSEIDLGDLNYLKYDFKIMDYFKDNPEKISYFLEAEDE